MTPLITKREKAVLRKLAGKAWEAELNRELAILFEHFHQWTKKDMNAFDLSDKIHEFHDGASRQLFKLYTQLDPVTAVSRAVTIGVLPEEDVSVELMEKLASRIEGFRDIEKE